ncbi:MAG TPA: HD domain-containing phosphohydrolase [Gaiellaceae bacterium]|nr:HD domain-containing phosphohydrolase [Gaiellaceae bacterium]
MPFPAYFGTSGATFALFAAVYLLALAVQRSEDDSLPEPLEGERFSLSAPLQLGAVLALGPWAAALIAVAGTLAVRPFRHDGPRALLVRSLGLAGAALAAGYAYELSGAVRGDVHLPQDVLPAVLAGFVHWTGRMLVEGLLREQPAVHPDFLVGTSEIGLGLILALAAEEELWLAAAVVPVLLLLDRLYGRIAVHRRETASALETFANIVDERDASTHGHSLRVAGYVRDLARALGMPATEVRRLWWAGRLHDLGKVAVDSSVLRKPGKLSPAEWGSIWRAPRLSARLLQRFRFAARQAQAVEYHRERYDGTGYYGAQPEDIPLAAHFLIVADSFDAMTSCRSFREPLSEKEALQELEDASGTQFHPTVAKAFIAVRRGEDPESALSRDELAGLRDAAAPQGVTFPRAAGELRRRHELFLLGGGIAVFAGLGAEVFELVAAGAAAILIGLKMWVARRLGVRRLTRALDRAFAVADGDEELFERFLEAVGRSWKLSYAALVAWEEDGAGGYVHLEHGDAEASEPVLISWLLREAESDTDVVLDAGSELPGGLVSLALPLRRENSALVGFVLIRAPRLPPGHLPYTLRGRLGRLVQIAEAERVVLGATTLDANARQEPRPLQA